MKVSAGGAIILGMHDFENSKTPASKTGWFDRLTRRMQALLLALLMFAFSAVALVFSVHDVHTGNMAVSMSGRPDPVVGFLLAGGAFALGAALLAVALGWLTFKKSEDSDNSTQR